MSLREPLDTSIDKYRNKTLKRGLFFIFSPWAYYNLQVAWKETVQDSRKKDRQKVKQRMKSTITGEKEAQLQAARIHYKYLYLACLGSSKLFYEWKGRGIVVPMVSMGCLKSV